jgi:hypothetical protein
VPSHYFRELRYIQASKPQPCADKNHHRAYEGFQNRGEAGYRELHPKAGMFCATNDKQQGDEGRRCVQRSVWIGDT